MKAKNIVETCHDLTWCVKYAKSQTTKTGIPHYVDSLPLSPNDVDRGTVGTIRRHFVYTIIDLEEG